MTAVSETGNPKTEHDKRVKRQQSRVTFPDIRNTNTNTNILAKYRYPRADHGCAKSNTTNVNTN